MKIAFETSSSPKTLQNIARTFSYFELPQIYFFEKKLTHEVLFTEFEKGITLFLVYASFGGCELIQLLIYSYLEQRKISRGVMK